MKPSVLIILLSVMLGSISFAEVPQKAALQNYSGLWTNSPFTTKPAGPDKTLLINPFDDYSLTGIAPIQGGYRITITNKKSKKKHIIEPGTPSEFKVISVDRNPEVSLGTTVTLTNGNLQGTVRFEPNLVVLNTPSTQKPAENASPTPDPNQPPPPPNGQVTPNAPVRSRIVAPANKPSQNPSVKNPQSRPSRTK